MAEAETQNDVADGKLSKNPVEKMRIRLAADSYNSKYDLMSEDSDMEQSKEKPSRCASCRCGRSLTPCIIVCVVGLLVGLGFALLAVMLKIRVDQSDLVCQAPNCVVTSGTMMSSMDLSVDRCEDFYHYACNNFINDVTIPADKLKFGILNGRVEGRRGPMIRKLLEADGEEFLGKNSTAVAKARLFYSACMNYTATEEQGSTPLLKLIRTMGSWTVTSDVISGTWSGTSWNLESVLATANLYGLSPFFEIYVAVDAKNSATNIINLDQSGLSMGSFEAYIGNSSDKYYHAFIDFFMDIAAQLGSKEDTRTLADEIWQFEKAIAQAFVRPEDRADVRRLYHMMSVDEVQQYFPNSFNLTRYLQLLYGSSFDISRLMNVRVPEYFQRLRMIMRVAKQSTMANYIVWHAVQSMVSSMSTPFHQAVLRFRLAIYGVQAEAQLWERCVKSTDSSLGFATGALYVDKYFSEQDRKKVEHIYELVIDSFKKRLTRVSWMDEVTRYRALEKLQAVQHQIGYPDFVLNPSLLDDYYLQFNVTNDNFQNVLNAGIYFSMRNRKRLGVAPDRNEWFMTPAEINAYYEPSVNQVVLPAGILQTPIYDRTFPMSLLFGSIGFIIGHEITHGFDNQGRQYNKFGDMADWWLSDAAQHFENMSQCFVDEYSGFRIYEFPVNGKSTLGENIADNGGLRITYNAFQSWLSKELFNDPLLPGLNMTHEQQFFLSFAQTWCTYYKPEMAIQLLSLDVHSNARDRVNGVLQNMPEFATAFSCSSSSKMNPSKKCSLW